MTFRYDARIYSRSGLRAILFSVNGCLVCQESRYISIFGLFSRVGSRPVEPIRDFKVAYLVKFVASTTSRLPETHIFLKVGQIRRHA
jgi:hypothetical protein